MKQYSIDLFGFLKMVLRHFIILLFCIGLGAGLGWGGSSLITPKWRAIAQFDAPTVPELGNYFSLFSTYQLLSGADHMAYKLVKEDNSHLVLTPEMTDSAESLAIEKSYNEFKRMLTSPDVLQQFLQQNDTVKQLAATQNMPVILLSQTLAEQFFFQPATRSMPVDRMNLVLENPEQASQLLTEFISFANLKARESLNAELIQKWKTLFIQVKNAAEMNLGAMQQGSHIGQQDWKGKFSMMRAVQPLDDELVAFRYIKTPTVPLTPDSPKKLLWLMIGTLSGFLLGIAVIVMLNLARAKRYNDVAIEQDDGNVHPH